MSNIGDVTVNVKVNLTIDDETAYTILGLLEMYCQDKKKKIRTCFRKKADSDEKFKICFDFEDDKEVDLINETTKETN